MCYPAIIPIVSAVLAVGTAVYSADVQKKSAEAQAEGLEQQAAIDRAQAADAQAMGDRESEQQTARTRIIQGQQRAAIAASGVDAGIGTPTELLGETAYFGEQEQQAIRQNAARNAWGFNANAIQSGNAARNARWQGKAGANATILGGLASAAGGLYSSGAFGAGAQSANIGPVTRQRINPPNSSYNFGGI